MNLKIDVGNLMAVFPSGLAIFQGNAVHQPQTGNEPVMDGGTFGDAIVSNADQWKSKIDFLIGIVLGIASPEGIAEPPFQKEISE